MAWPVGRRAWLAGAGLLVAGGAARAEDVPTLPPGGSLAFRIMRKGERIGTHALAFQSAGEALTVRIDVEIVVRVLMVPVFRYTHRNVERWEGGRLAEFAADTDHDGSRQHASAHRAAGGGKAAGLVVEGTKAGAGDTPGRYTAPPDSIAGTHWNRRELDAPIINPEHGRLDHPAVRDAGSGPVPRADGTMIDARRYVLSGDARLELFYTAAGAWSGLAFDADDGSVVSYELL